MNELFHLGLLEKEIEQLEAEIERLKAGIRSLSESSNICVFDLLNEICTGCRCWRGRL